eukprot:TRINITY_DN13557_c0_g1_i1.p1 TRINITY_DN13557_c0_g1~~TRINITY_DN13557_c0_g1_i1.p1  ORF type:complete len:217 (-),score=29.39 TRINITY_DN13557_c0_g1_i1:163-753(-)
MAQRLRTPLRVVDESERKQKGSQTSQQPAKTALQRAAKRKIAPESTEQAPTTKRTKSPDFNVTKGGSSAVSSVKALPAAAGPALEKPGSSSARATTGVAPSRPTSMIANAGADVDPQGPLSPRRNSRGSNNQHLLQNFGDPMDSFTYEAVFSSEALFLKKHNREAIARRMSKKPYFETEEEELEWMFPTLRSDSEN